MESELILLLGMAVFALATISFILLTIINNQNKRFSKERTDYINRIISKSSEEYIRLKKSDTSEEPKAKTDKEILGDDYRFFGGKLN